MLFTDSIFIIGLTVLFIVYFLVPQRFRWMLLLIGSIGFYAYSGPFNLIYIFVTALSTFLITNRIAHMAQKAKDEVSAHKSEWSRDEKKEFKEKAKKKRFRWLVLCLLLNFGMLAVIKYGAFTMHNVNTVIGWFGSSKTLPVHRFLLPMGMSFYLFQTMGYAIDVYREKYDAEKNFARLSLFVSFFPQLIQGPISRYDDLSKGLYAGNGFESKRVMLGIQRILWGYFKKVALADRVMPAVSALISNTDEHQGMYVLLGILYYTLRIYADFTGGIDITIGIGQVLGIPIAENFERPFFSKNITEYWRRWHITLGTWFKDYLFYPVSVCQPMLKLSKWSREKLGKNVGKYLPVYISTIAVWFVTGLWHGAAWNFIVWGLMNAVVILISERLTPLYTKFHKKFGWSNTRAYDGFMALRTTFLMGLLRMFDCYLDVPLTFKMFGTMFYKWNPQVLWNGSLMKLGLSKADYIVLGAGVLLLFTASMLGRRGSVRARLYDKSKFLSCCLTVSLLLIVVIFGAYGIGYDSSQFIYNQF
ncbi:MAG: MBOAT family protein [Oscillospiraceae bacterium]|nr:MBOAT family protein [Oscillospiraceae bacterium]